MIFFSVGDIVVGVVAGMILHRSHKIIAPLIVGGCLVDRSIGKIGETLGCRGTVAGDDHAGVGINFVGNAYGGIESCRAPVVGHLFGGGQLADDTPEEHTLFACLPVGVELEHFLAGFLFIAFTILFTRGDSNTDCCTDGQQHEV